jgi:hypothetical protein
MSNLPKYIAGGDLNFTYTKEVRHNPDGTKTIYFLPVTKFVPTTEPKIKKEKKEQDFFIKL